MIGKVTDIISLRKGNSKGRSVVRFASLTGICILTASEIVSVVTYTRACSDPTGPSFNGLPTGVHHWLHT